MKKTKDRGGRPTREDASRRALKNVDVEACDPVSVLRSIAADRSAPASARVAACRALLDLAGDSPSGRADDVNARAIQILRRLN